MPAAARLVVVGEALVDVVLAPGADPVEAVGGSPMNVAVGLARLDVPTLLLTRVGDDYRGHRVLEHLRDSDVPVSHGSVVRTEPTSTATARIGADGAADYAFDVVWRLAAQPLPESLGLHAGSLGIVLEPGRSAVLQLMDQAVARDLFVSLDPNVRPTFLADPAAAWVDLLDVARRCVLVKMSDEDLALLRPGLTESERMAEAVPELLGGGRTELVIVTRGGQGAWASTERHTVEVPAPETSVVDTVGAGDSFMSATLAVLSGADRLQAGALRTLSERQLADLLADAMEAAAVTCSRRGANPPRRREMPTGWPRLR